MSAEKSKLGAIPVISMTDYREGDADTVAAFIDTLGRSLREYGFVRVKGHAVTPEVVDPAYAAAKAFFALPEADKEAYVVPGGAGQRGYTPFGAEHAKDEPRPDLKEFWHVGRELPADHPLYAAYPPNLWPAEVPEFKEALLHLYNTLEGVAEDLLEAIALHLGEDKHRFTSLTETGNSIIRCLHYPPLGDIAVEPGAVRAAAHEDINFITLLVTSSHSGLELLRHDGTWMAVNAEPGEILMDSGDMMKRITSGVIPATRHRVVNPDDSNSERFSMPFFAHPRPEAVLSVVDSCRGEGFPEPAEDITGQAFLDQRLAEIGLM